MTHLNTHWWVAAAALVTACEFDFKTASDGSAADCPALDEPFKVQIVVLTENEKAPTATSWHDLMDDGEPITLEGDTGLVRRVDGETLLRREVEVHLTNNFVTAEDYPGGPRVCDEDGRCISFEVADIVFRADISEDPADTSEDPDDGCPELLALGDISETEYATREDSGISLSTAINDAVDACGDPKVRAEHAINLYIFDNCSFDDTGDDVRDEDGNLVGCVKEKGSRGRNNKPDDGIYSPYVFLDVARLQHTTQAPEEHEFGHAFGLNHTCAPGVDEEGDTANIMQSECHGAESGGRRNLGFSVVKHYDISQDPCDTGCTEEKDQVATIIKSAKAFLRSWDRDCP